MSPPPRRLTFAVSTSLLTASLSLGAAGCDEQTTEPDADKHVNEGPKKAPEEDHVNVGPEQDDGSNTPEPEPEPNVNEGPEPDPDAEPPRVNEGPAPEPAPEPKHVNVRSPKDG